MAPVAVTLYAMKLGEFELNEPVPELKDPHLLAVLRPWIDVGRVGSMSLNRLERHLRAKELGRLHRPGLFYDFTRYRPRSFFNEGKREVSIPNTIVRYAQREEGPDLLLAHLLEPHLYGEDYTDSMLELLNHLGVKRYSLVGAMYDMVPHTRPLLVSGSGAGGELDEEQRQVRVQSSDYEGPTTITYLIPQEAARQGIETRTYVVHLPQYYQVDEDMMGTARLTELLCSLYNLPQRLIQLERGTEQYETVADMVKGEGEDITSLLQQLEEHYDREQREKEPPPPPLSANIEEFLRDLNQEFDRPEGN
ncbi:MAG: PAC2 family protein [Chloroflexi bacterium]|nr:PAC2 family protein [Chloroflexota bacterium]